MFDEELIDTLTFDSLATETGAGQDNHNPCRALVRAVLIDLFAAKRSVTTRRKQKKQDRKWVMSDQEYPFSFVWVCQHLDLPVSRVRNLYFSETVVKITRPCADVINYRKLAA